MEITIQEFHGVKYQTPLGFDFLDKDIDDYPSFCGAGSGIGDKVVPEKIGGMPCSHICHVHDEWWEMCDPTWLAFLRGNMAFGYNLAVYLFLCKTLGPRLKEDAIWPPTFFPITIKSLW